VSETPAHRPTVSNLEIAYPFRALCHRGQRGTPELLGVEQIVPRGQRADVQLVAADIHAL
jgi:hypothetical protein